ncbi:MAG: bifunctional 4-hydroxy-2-oxoglutarate aldolase/2-dehydro-3-deoxy-phosphogluconate aldolase [Deinococcales bacterium]
MLSRLKLYQSMIGDGLVPLFYHPDSDTAIATTEALIQAGARLLEFTNRGPQALKVFGELVNYCQHYHPNFILGVGSIEDAPTAALFLAQGAQFIVGPNAKEEIAKLCNQRKIAYIPGCGSINEITLAESWGLEIIKLFPANLYGPEFIKALKGPRPWSSIMPTGGVKLEEKSLRAWFEAGAVCVGGGSDLISQADLASKDGESIRKKTQAALELIRRIRQT